MALIAYPAEYRNYYPLADADLQVSRDYWLSCYRARRSLYFLRNALECARAWKWLQSHPEELAKYKEKFTE